MRKRSSVLVIVSDAILVACCAIAATCAVPTAYETEFNLFPVVLSAVLLSLILSAAIHLTRKLWYIPCTVFALAAVVYGLVCKAKIVAGAKLCWYSMASLLSMDFSFLPVPEVPEMVEAVQHPAASVTAFLILAAAVFALAAAILYIKCKSPIPALAVPVPALFLGLIYTDCPPALYTVVLLAIYWGGVLFGREAKKRDPGRVGKMSARFILMLAVLAVLILLAFHPDRYKPIPFSERRGFISERLGRAQDMFLSRNMSNPDRYDLSGEDDRYTSEKKAFSIRTDSTGTFLLRVHSYGRYSRNVWEASPEYVGTWNSLHALGRTQSGECEKICIRDAYTDERITPYAFIRDDQVSVEEGFVRSYGKTAYVWTFMPELEFAPVKVSFEEEQYYHFALKQYTLPDGWLREKMLRLYEALLEKEPAVTEAPDTEEPILDTPQPDTTPSVEETDNGKHEKNPYEIALEVAELVRSSAEYSLTPGSIQRGSDFIEYFLNVNKQGYCVHFASATTAILQALGVPARYVIGYRVSVDKAGVWTDVARKTSHAWTEVYIKGVGWVPIESTPGYSEPNEYSPQPGSLITPSESGVPVEITARPTFSNPTDPDITPKPTREPREPITPGITPAPSNNGGDKTPSRWLQTLLWVLLVIAAVILLWTVIGAIVKKLRMRRFEQKDAKAAVLAMIRYLIPLKRYGAERINNAKALAEEAAFSNHSMNEKQQELLEQVRRTQKTLCKDKPFKRFVLSWLLFRI